MPQRAVSDLQGSYQVAVVGADDKVNIRNVTVGERTGELWVIREGIKPDERVITEGIIKSARAPRFARRKTRRRSRIRPTPTPAPETGGAN